MPVRSTLENCLAAGHGGQPLLPRRRSAVAREGKATASLGAIFGTLTYLPAMIGSVPGVHSPAATVTLTPTFKHDALFALAQTRLAGSVGLSA